MVEYSEDGVAIMLYNNDAAKIYRSTDDTRTFTSWRNTATWGDINAWVVPNASTVWAAAENGFWSTALVGNRLDTTKLVSVARSGDAVAVGTDGGLIYVSINKGNTWGTAIDAGDAVDISVYVAFDANYASNKLLYYATSDGVVGKVLLDGNNLSTATNSNVELEDGDLDACEGNAFNAIIVAPDNALYVGGTYLTTTGATSGTPTIAAGGKVQIKDDAGGATPGLGEITFATAKTIEEEGIVGTFIDGEVLLVIGDNLIVDGSGTTVTGTIQVKGVSSNATGYVTVTGATIDNKIGTWTATDTVSVTSSNLLFDYGSTGGSPST
jgi:hypothetical protein